MAANYITKNKVPYTGQQGKRSQFIGTYAASTLSMTPSVDTVYYIPIEIAFDVHIDQMAVEVSTAEATKVAVVGIYAFERGEIKDKIFNGTEFGVGSTGVKTTNADVYLSSGTYIFAYFQNALTAQLKKIAATFKPILGHASNTETDINSHYEESLTYTSVLPVTVGTLSLSNTDPMRIWARIQV